MWFPHLVNGGKYTFTILYYMTLSIWRVDKASTGAKAAFIACAAINAIYTSLWDVAMDWSLLNPYSKHPLLRNTLGFKQTWPYYTAMVIDPIIRFEWIFYVIFADDLQHSAVLSFALSLAEVLRRFVWCFFRMENEHVGNVGAYRAYRDPPLPYSFAAESDEGQPLYPIPESEPHDEGTGFQGQRRQQTTDDHRSSHDGAQAITTSAEVDLERMETARQRVGVVRTMTRVGRTLQDAHLHDYERKRLREGEDSVAGDDGESESSSEETDDDEVEKRIEMERLHARKRRQSKANEERGSPREEVRRSWSGGSAGRRSSDI